MCVSAALASSEKAYLIAGAWINENRSGLHRITVKKQLFVHDNRIFLTFIRVEVTR